MAHGMFLRLAAAALAALPSLEAAEIARLEVRQPPAGDFLVTASIALSSPDLMKQEWTLGGKPVQREIISRDAAGEPAVVQAIGRVSSQQGPYALTASAPAAAGPAAGAAPSPQVTVGVSASLTIGDKVYVAKPRRDTTKTLRQGPWCTTVRTFSQFENGDEKVMGAHFYVSQYPAGWEVIVRISNAVINVNGSGFNGAVYYDKLAITVEGKEYVLAAPLPPGQKHLFLPQMQTQRRYESGSTPRFARVIADNGFHKVAAYGAERMKLFQYTPAFTHGNLAGWDAIDAKCEGTRAAMQACFDTGQPNKGLEMHSPALGPFMPLYLADSGSGAPGGWGIVPAEGYQQTQSGVEMMKLLHRATMDRIPTLVLNPQGEMISTYDFAAAAGGVQPFYHNVIGSWTNEDCCGDSPPYFKGNQGRPYNQGNCPYKGAKYRGGLKDYEYYDDAHYSRGTRFPKALVYMVNDPAARDDLVQMAEEIHYSYGEIPHGNQYWIPRSHSLWKSLERAQARPNQGGHFERAFGWACDAMAQAYAVADPAWRKRNKPWFDALDKLVGLVMMPSGLLERQPGGGSSPACQDALKGGIPADSDIAGAIYVGIVCQGLGACRAAAMPESKNIRECLDKTVTSMFEANPNSTCPPYYVSVAAAKGGAPYGRPRHFVQKVESFNFWWASMHAYYATGNKAHFERLRKYDTNPAQPPPTHEQRVDMLLRAASGWDDRLGNCAYYIAEVQSPGPPPLPAGAPAAR